MDRASGRSSSPRTVLYLIGLGSGPAERLTLEAWEHLASGEPLMIRDTAHEAAQTVLARGIPFERADDGDPEAVSRSVLQWASEFASSVYAVPGDVMEAPETLHILKSAGRSSVEVRVLPGVSDPDRFPASDPLTRSHVTREAYAAGQAFIRLIQVMGRLRGPDGCPWDRRQTHASLAVHLLEETYEALDAIDRDDLGELREELGDLLLQIVFHSELAREAGRFEIAEVIEILLTKLVHRHPHVFGDTVVESAQEVVVNWEALKREEKRRDSLLEGIPANLPALLYSYKLQRRLVRDGRTEETPSRRVVELAAAAEEGASEGLIGDLLFSVVSLAVAAGIDPEGALRKRSSAFAAAFDA